MSYELVLAAVPPDIPDPVERAYELMNPFSHTECCLRWQDEDYDDEDYGEPPTGVEEPRF